MSTWYNAGDVIMDGSLPLMKIMLPEHREKRCNNCFAQKDELEPCPNCRWYKYCDNNCRQQDWNNGHALECKSETFHQCCSKGYHVNIKTFVFRMYAFFKLNPGIEHKPFRLHNGKTRCFNDMIANEEGLASKEHFVSRLKEMVRSIKLEDPESDVELAYLQRLLGIHFSNSFSISDELDVKWIGWGLYIEPAVFDHSCKPNAVYINFGLRLQVRAVARIMTGEVPSISYLGSTMEKQERRAALLENYNFMCYCLKCESHSDGLVNYADLRANEGKIRTVLKSRGKCAETWTDVYKLHLDIIGVLQEVYNRYDSHITLHHHRVLRVALKLGVNSRKTLKDLYGIALRHMAVTYGAEHLKYRNLETQYNQEFLQD